MARRTISMIEVNEVLYRWCKKMGKKPIARSLRMSVNTVRDLIIQAQGFGLRELKSSLDEINEVSQKIIALRRLKRAQPGVVQARIAVHHEQLEQWWITPNMTVRQMQRLLSEQGDIYSETSLRRYIHSHLKGPQKGVIPLTTVPGKEAQVDFGYVGQMIDPKTGRNRKAYAFVMTLSHSRYRFVRFTFKQNVAIWIDCHIRAFEFFGGVPAVLMPDNLKSAVITPDFYDPTINRVYSELERYYGFIVDPTKVRTPKHKGKVERSIPIVRQQVIAGRMHGDIEEANAYALRWARYEIAQRVTRTTGESPWTRFERDERAKLGPIPKKRFECPTWQKAQVHPDHHVVFKGAFYSVPYQYLGKVVWVRANDRNLKIYCDDTLIKVHVLAHRKGEWVTDKLDYPEQGRQYLCLDERVYQEQANLLGEAVHQFIKPLLTPLTRTRQRKIFALFRLAEKHGNKRLNDACQRALMYGNTELKSIRNILEKGLDKALPSAQESPNLSASLEGAYLRNSSEFCIKGGSLSWTSTQ